RLMDKYSHGEDAIKPSISKGKVLGLTPDRVDAGHAAMELCQRLVVEIHSVNVVCGQISRNPAKVSAGVTPNLQRPARPVRGYEVLPERAALFSGVSVPYEVFVTELP